MGYLDMENKIEIAKALGLELFSHSEESLRDEIDRDDFYEVIFTFNDKFFTVTIYNKHKSELKVCDFWEEATNIVLGKLLDFITMDNKFRDNAW